MSGRQFDFRTFKGQRGFTEIRRDALKDGNMMKTIQTAIPMYIT